MKNVHFLYLVTLLLIITNILVNACPTCIGKLERTTPPFFSKEYEDYCQGCHIYNKKTKPQQTILVDAEDNHDADV